MPETQTQSGKKKNEAVAFVFKTSESTYFDLAKSCLERIITRKLMNNSTDEFCLILFGTEDNNDFEYDNIVCPFALERCTWEMLRYLKTQVEPSKVTANWFDALSLAANKLRLSEHEGKRIVTFYDFAQVLDNNQLDSILEELTSLGVSLTIVAPAHIQEAMCTSDDAPAMKRIKKSEEESEAIEILSKMWEKLEDKMELTSYEEALRQVTVYKSELKKGRPWNVDLTIADIRIPVAAFLKVTASTKKPTTRTRLMATSVNVTQLTASEMMEVETTPVVPVKKLTTVGEYGDEVSIAMEEVGRARAYGNTLVPFSDEDRAAMSYNAGVKCLSVLFFTTLAKLKRHYLVGKGCHVVTPQKNSDGITFSALVQALHRMDRAAVARKVYYNNGALSLVLLSPIWEEWEDDGKAVYKQCLVMNELVWKEGLKLIPFPTLNYTPTDEQTKAIDDMIDAMDLMTASKGPNGEATEAFQISQLMEDKNEFYVHCLVERALFPDKPLPKSLPHSFNSISWPKATLDKLDVVKELFPITIKPDKREERKEKYRSLAMKRKEGENAQLEEDDEMDVISFSQKIVDFPKPEIDTEDAEPVRDVKVVFREQMLPPPRALVGVLQIYLEDKMDISNTLLCIEKCVAQLRDFAMKVNPKEFNDWLSEISRIAPDSGGLYEFFSKLERIPTEDFKTNAGKPEDSPPASPDHRSTLDIEKSQALHEFF